MEDAEKTIILPISPWPEWKTVRRIGGGSYGAVYEIERTVGGVEEKSALKVLSIPHSSDEVKELKNMGYSEAGITKYFDECLLDVENEYGNMVPLKSHENIVRCEDIRKVQHKNASGWDVYIRMELLTGLTDYLEKKYSGTVVIPDEEVIEIGIALCNALVACKKHKIIHRDIKPQNILVSENGVYKLGDFGTARTMEKVELTKTVGIGTKGYMAPEVEKIGKYDYRADIYSAGMALYWLLNERRQPFLPLPPQQPGLLESQNALNRRLAGEAIPEPAHGSDKLKKIVLKACSFKADDRFSDAQEMLDALESLSASAPVKGEDIEVSIDISFEEASRGCRKVVPVPGDESVPVNVPAGIQNGQTVTVKGKGHPGKNGGPEGDLIVKVRVHEKKKKTPEELYREGLRRYEEKNYRNAFDLFSQAANGGNPDAMNFLGLLYEDGKGADSDCSKALKWYEKAAAAGNVAAMNNIGDVYANGKGVRQDYIKAKDCYEKAAAAGSATAMENLGWIYQNGLGIAIDYSKAKEWYEKSVAAGNEEAKDALDELQKLMGKKLKGDDSKPLLKVIILIVAASLAAFAFLNAGNSKSAISLPSESVETDDSENMDVGSFVTFENLEQKNNSSNDKEEIVTFGSFEQNNNTSDGKEKIEWTVLKTEGNRSLLISKYALDCRLYNTEQASVTWENCSLRKWLNEVFFNVAFSAEEQKMIETAIVTADINPICGTGMIHDMYGTEPGNETKDKVFLLSIDEVNSYFSSDEAKKCAPTACAKAQGAYTDDGYLTQNGKAACCWWLRTPGYAQNVAAYIFCDGVVNCTGAFVDRDEVCVRPAMWVNLGP